MFHREVEALDWRLHELDQVVDDFVVVESRLTFSGKPRALVRPHRDERFADMAGRLHVAIIKDPPEGPDPRKRERNQRKAIWKRGAAELATADSDLIIVCDVDEVPFPEVVDRLAWSRFDEPVFVRPHWFNFNWNTYLGAGLEPSIRFYTAGFLRRLFAEGRGGEMGRSTVRGRELDGLLGWHASWFGTDEVNLDKLASHSHARDARRLEALAEGAEGIRRRRAAGSGMFGIGRRLGAPPRLPVHAYRVPGVSATQAVEAGREIGQGNGAIQSVAASDAAVAAGPEPASNEPVPIDSLERRPSRRRVICGCTFHHEVACLDWRLHELAAVVDDFVVVESVLTQSGLPRSVIRPDLDPQFAWIAGRFHGTVIEDPPRDPDPWVRERTQREAVWTRGAALLDPPDDALIIISDFDEVPFPEVVEQLAWSEFDTPLYIRPQWFNFSWATYLGPWMHASIRCYPAGFLRRLFAEGRGELVGRGEVPGRELAGLNGWHASWFGSDEVIFDKLLSYVHVADEKDRIAIAEGIEGIRRRRASGFDLFGIRQAQGTAPRLPVHAHRFAGVSAADVSAASP